MDVFPCPRRSKIKKFKKIYISNTTQSSMLHTDFHLANFKILAYGLAATHHILEFQISLGTNIVTCSHTSMDVILGSRRILAFHALYSLHILIWKIQDSRVLPRKKAFSSLIKSDSSIYNESRTNSSKWWTRTSHCTSSYLTTPLPSLYGLW